MIIAKNRTKVKKSFNLINNSNEDLSKPEKKFLQEMIIGMILSGSCNLTEKGNSKKVLQNKMFGRYNNIELVNACKD